MRPCRSVIVQCLIAASLAAAALTSAVPAAAEAHTFDGSCAGVYITRFAAPPTLIPAVMQYQVLARGTCFGSLDGRPLPHDGTPMVSRFGGTALISCETASDDDPEVPLVFLLGGGDRVTLGTHISDRWLLVGSAFTGTGNQSGNLFGTSQAQGSSDGLSACADGEASSAAVSTDFHTITPLVG